MVKNYEKIQKSYSCQTDTNVTVSQGV